MTHSDTPNESDLIGRLRRSDREAFRLLFEEYQPILFRFILYHAHDRELTHDIVQETFLRVWDARASLRPKLSFLAYLFRISRNLLRDRLRRDAVKKRFEEEIAPAMQAAADDPNDTLHAMLLEERLADIIRQRLPPRCRTIFLLSRMELLSNNEIAKRLHISPKTVENQITRALKILRKHLKE